MGKYEVDALKKIYLLNCFYSNDFYVKKICTNLSSRMFKIVLALVLVLGLVKIQSKSFVIQFYSSFDNIRPWSR